MRIHDQNPAGGLPDVGGGTTGTQGTTVGQGTTGTQGIGGRGGAVQGTEQAGNGPDRVSLSNLAANLGAEAGPAAQEREAELERLSEVFDRGVYAPDVGAVAEKLIDEALTTPPDETEGGSGALG